MSELKHTRDGLVIEVFIVPGYEVCPATQALARQVAETFGLSYKETNLLTNPERFSQLGVEAAPAIALDGELGFRKPPSEEELRREVRSRLTGYRR